MREVTKPPRNSSTDFANTLRSLEPSKAGLPLPTPSRELDAVPVRSERYTVGPEIAQGNTSTTYEAFDVLLHRRVALKVLHPLLATHPESRRRFVENAKATAELDHAGIVPVHDAGQLPDGRTFVAMRLLSGKTLGRALSELRASGDARALLPLLRAFVRACETVALAHARGVIHRDLHANNVLLGDFGEVFVLDWGLFKWSPMPLLAREGLAPSADDHERRARASSRKGARPSEAPNPEIARLIAAAPYMAPEQLRGEGLDTLTDVYGLGVVLYAIACGDPPIESTPGEPLADLLARVTTATRQLPSERRQERRAGQLLPWRVPAQLDAACARALSVNRDMRYPSVLALIADLSAYLDGRSGRQA